MHYTCSGLVLGQLGRHTHQLISGGKTRSLQLALAVGVGLLPPSICSMGGQEPCMGVGQESSSSAVPVLRGRGAGRVTDPRSTFPNLCVKPEG